MKLFTVEEINNDLNNIKDNTELILNISKFKFDKLIYINLLDNLILEYLNTIDIKIDIEDILNEYSNNNSNLIVFNIEFNKLGNYNTNRLINILEHYEFIQYNNYFIYCGNSAGIKFKDTINN